MSLSMGQHYKRIAMYLSKEETLDVDPKATQQINFTGNLYRSGNTTIFLIMEGVK